MKALKIFGLAVIAGVSMVVSSCDPYGGYEYWIDNKSDSTLFVVYRFTNNDSLTKISIDKNEIRLIDEFETISGLYDKGDEFLSHFDSLGIFIDTIQVTSIKKDYWRRREWTYKQEATGMFGSAGDNIYRIEIKNEDLK